MHAQKKSGAEMLQSSAPFIVLLASCETLNPEFVKQGWKLPVNLANSWLQAFPFISRHVNKQAQRYCKGVSNALPHVLVDANGCIEPRRYL